MYVEVVTTITSKIKIGENGVDKIDHAVSVEGGEFGAAAGETGTLLVVKGGLQSALNSVNDMLPSRYLDEDDED